jgi:hypothetical protein
MPAKQLHWFHRLPLQVDISVISSCSYDNRIADATTARAVRLFNVQSSTFPPPNLEP